MSMGWGYGLDAKATFGLSKSSLIVDHSKRMSQSYPIGRKWKIPASVRTMIIFTPATMTEQGLLRTEGRASSQPQQHILKLWLHFIPSLLLRCVDDPHIRHTILWFIHGCWSDLSTSNEWAFWTMIMTWTKSNDKDLHSWGRMELLHSEQLNDSASLKSCHRNGVNILVVIIGTWDGWVPCMPVKSGHQAKPHQPAHTHRPACGISSCERILYESWSFTFTWYHVCHTHLYKLLKSLTCALIWNDTGILINFLILIRAKSSQIITCNKAISISYQKGSFQ